MIYNFELIFSMRKIEGVGAFSFGVGKRAIYPCGKTTVMNFISVPSKGGVEVFDALDSNIFSNG